jgi:hypothetical protein
MNALELQNITCPYCGETIEVLFDCSVSYQNYIEDCEVCCRPIIFDVAVSSEGALSVNARHENE